MGTDRRELLNDNEEAMRLVLDGRQVGIWTAIPGIIEAINFTAMTCTIQPAIQASTVDQNGVSTLVNLPQLVDCPIIFPSGGGYLMTFPLAVGDEVLVVFSCRCIDAWWQSGGIQKPAEVRMHDLSDGFAIPGPFSQPKLPAGAVSSNTAQLRNAAGTAYVEIDGSGNINLVGAKLQFNGINFHDHEHLPGTFSNSGGPVTGISGKVTP
jgi:hypothetical protein